MVASVVFCGSRSLSPSFAPEIAGAVRSVLAGGRGVAVGCCPGADLDALRSWLGPWRELLVGENPSGLSGSCRRLRRRRRRRRGGLLLSFSLSPFLRLAASRGASVSWLAGGPLSLPLSARLAARSAACVRFAAASGPGAGLVCFGLRPSSRGSLLACSLAVSCGLPVVVFPCGAPLAVLGPGSWRPAGSGVWSAAVRWSPVSLFALAS